MMTRSAFFALIPFLFLFFISCDRSSNQEQNDSKIKTSSSKDYFPFEISEQQQPTGLGSLFTIMAPLESNELYPSYADLFEKYGYTGNGVAWQGIIIQILEKEDPAILLDLQFDCEAGAFLAYTKSKENQLKFVERLSPIFADKSKLEVYIKKADRSRVDD